MRWLPFEDTSRAGAEAFIWTFRSDATLYRVTSEFHVYSMCDIVMQFRVDHAFFSLEKIRRIAEALERLSESILDVAVALRGFEPTLPGLRSH
jgi:hypothetical protein